VEAGRPSWTAEMVAAVRADHALHDRPVVFDDPFALALVSEELQASIRSGDFSRGFAREGWRRTRGHLVARARYADDAARAAFGRGVRQLLVLAAGLDTSALRCDAGILVVEVDHPATQALKRQRLAALAPPRARLELAAVDFETTPLAQALAATSWDPSRPGLATWLGVTMYLDAAALRGALRGIRDCLAPGSELVFDYPVPIEWLGGELRRAADEKRTITAAHGEAKRATWHPDALRAELEAAGFALALELDSDALDARYFACRADGLGATPEHRIAHARAV
jgi:methyltransferase (TIGR00027 family)